MGFTTGFTGGVTLVLGTAYLATSAHRLHRERQADALRSQTLILTKLAARSPTDTFHSVYYPSSSTEELTAPAPLALPIRPSERAALARASFVETAKDRWNAEVEGAVRWVQEKDWVAVRQDAEDVVARLWGQAGGPEAVARVEEKAIEAKDAAVAKGAELSAQGKAAVEDQAAAAQRGAREIASSAKAAAEQTKIKGTEVASRARSTAVQTKERSKDVASDVKEDSREAAKSFWERGLSTGRAVVDQTKAAVGAASDKVSQAFSAPAATIPTTSEDSAIEKALHQRYEDVDAVPRKSVDQLLAERYVPIDRRDNTELRGL